MKKLCMSVSVFLFITGIFSVNAQDIIIMRDGNIIEAKVMEIHSSEIRYKRINNPDGPMIVISKDGVLSIRYENGAVDIINTSPVPGRERDQTNAVGSNDSPQPGAPTALQTILNALPPIPIAGNNLKFQFSGDKWTATVNGENFSAGNVEAEDTNDGSILTLKQTHIWPGAVGRNAGRFANRIPGGATVGGALNAAGTIAGAVGPIEVSGPAIVLEYKAGPPAKLSFLRSSAAADSSSDNQTASVHPLLAKNRFDLDGFNAFAISFTGMPTFWWGYGGGLTITIFEGYKPNAFFTPSYFLSGKFIFFEIDNGWGDILALSPGVLFKHRFPGNRVLWNLGGSFDFMWVWGSTSYEGYYYDNYYRGNTFLVGMGIQTGFSFRFNPYTSLDLNGLLKFPFGTVEMKNNWTGDTKSFWPFTGGIELGFTIWFPYRSRSQKQ